MPAEQFRQLPLDAIQTPPEPLRGADTPQQGYLDHLFAEYRAEVDFRRQEGLPHINLDEFRQIFDTKLYDEPEADLSIASPTLVDFTAEHTEAATNRMREAMSKFTSEADFRRYLDFQTKQYTYSPYNCMLILSQKPDATMVMPYGKKDGSTGWKSLGRFVKKGESGIGILAPMFRGKRDTDEERLIGYKRVYVYDVSQTDGAPLPEPPKPTQLDGDDPLGGEVFSRLLDFLDDLAIDVDTAPLGRPNGVFSPTEGKIVLNDQITGDQAVKTLWHETAHALTIPYAESQRIDRRDAETIAETTAYIGLSHFGIDTSSYSFNYVGGWAQDMERFEKNVTTAQHIARDLITAVRVGRSPWTLKGGR